MPTEVVHCYETVGKAAPACVKHFFPHDETSGTALHDTVGGCVWDVAGHTTLGFGVAAGVPVGSVMSYMGPADAPIALSAGAFHTFDSSKAMMAVVAGYITSAVSAVRWTIGDANNLLQLPNPAGVGIEGYYWHALCGPAVNNCRVNSDPAILTPPVSGPNGNNIGAFAGQDVVMVFVYSNNSNAHARVYSLSDGSFLLQDWGIDHALLSGLYTPTACMRNANFAAYGAAYLEFVGGLPANWVDIAVWYGKQWKALNKTPFNPYLYLTG